nr:hypothetical protein [Tanacetum cinerariifolium]
MHPNRGGIDKLDADKDVTLVYVDAKVEMDANIQGMMVESQAKVYSLDLQHTEKVLSMQDTDEVEPAEVEEVLKVITTAKLMIKVVTTATQVPKPSAPRKRRGVVIQDPEEKAAASVIVHSKVKSKDKGKGILIEEPKPLKRQAQVKHDEAFARQLEAELNGNINWNDVLEQKAAKKQRIVEEAKELKRDLQIVVNDDDDIFTEATPLASKRLIKERFKSTEPKNFSDDFLLNTFKIMFEKPNVEANIWREQKGRYDDPTGCEEIPLDTLTLEQILNNVRLEVEEVSEMSLELL